MLFLIIFLLTISKSFSQKETYNCLIMGVPQYLLINGIRIDIDKSLNKSNRWVVISPQFYYANDYAMTDIGYRDFEIKKVIGGGTGLEYKYVFSTQSNAKGIYISTGLSYNYFKITTDGITWVPETTGALTLVQREGTFNTRINKIGIQSTIGYCSELFDKFLVDVFIGFGLRLCLDDTPGDSFTDLSTYAGDYGYSGTTLVTGIRFGLGY